MIFIRHGVILDPHMPQRVLLALAPGIIRLGGEHVAVVLGDQQGFVRMGGHRFLGLAAGIVSGVGEVVVGVDIFQQIAFFNKPDAGGGTAGIQLPGSLVRQPVQFIVILAFVDAHAPQDDAGMVPVLQHHLPGIFHSLIFPVSVTDVLPAGDLGEYQQAQPVAFVNKMVALGIVGGADRGAAQFFFQDPGILPLEALRCGISHIGPALVPVQAPEEGFLTI